MLVEINLYDVASRTILCQIEGEWSYAGYNHIYTQLVEYARQMPDKMNLILEVSNASELEANTNLLCVSPFIHHAVLVTDNVKHPLIKQLQQILHLQNPEISLSHSRNINHALAKIQGEFTVRA